MDLLYGLNDGQKTAVTTTEGYVRVVAGAGSGKTDTLARRFAYLVDEMGILPGNILCVTFTNKAAGEMRKRIHQLTGDNDTGYINTFHGLCVTILQEDAHAVQYPKNFLVLDNSDIDAMLRIIYEERGLTLRDMTFSKAREQIEMRKCLQQPDYYLDMLNLSLEVLQKKYQDATDPMDIIFYGYLYQEKKCFGLDYNDLLNFTLHIFAQNEAIRLKWQKRLVYIMVDEFQDIDGLQYRLMEVLQGYHKNLFVVGDPDQTIYTWRGANGKYMIDFDQAFPGCGTVRMLINYRSTPQILGVANSLIESNRFRIKKHLLPMKPDGLPVICHHADSPESEAAMIVGRMGDLHDQGIPYGSMAILYRAHYISRPLEDALLKADIPYAIYSGVPFFDRAEIKDALSYLRMIAYRDDLSFLRIANVPKRNLGQRRMAFLQEYAEVHRCSLYDALVQNVEADLFKGTQVNGFLQLVERFSANYSGRPVSEVLAEVLSESGYEAMLRTEGSQERLDNLAELKQSIYEYETTCGEDATLEHYLAHVATFTNSDLVDTGDRVKLMTIHAAKGLQFPYVFLCQLNEGVFPTRKTTTLEAMEEERRLAFVAITRAEKGLVLSESGGRSHDGAPRYPSRFLLDIDPKLMEFPVPLSPALIQDAKKVIQRSNGILESEKDHVLLPIGTRVHHDQLGDGQICEQDSGAGIVERP